MAASDDLVGLTAHIVSAYIEKNPIPSGGLPALIAGVGAAIAGLSKPAVEPEPQQVPAVNPKKSVFPDYIVCLEDGKKFKSLRRHLSAHFGLSPDEYRAKWNLPGDYPMVAPAYAAARSEMAKAMGLGRKPGKAKAKRNVRRSST